MKLKQDEFVNTIPTIGMSTNILFLERLAQCWMILREAQAG